MVVVMTVHPGFGGQSFLAENLEKVKAIRAHENRLGSGRGVLDVEVDGGIDTRTALQSQRAGANVFVVKDGAITTFDVSPEDAGLPIAQAQDLKGGDAEHNAGALRAVMDGAPGPYRDVVVYNAAGVLIVAGKADDLKSGAALAAAAIDDGKAKAALDTLIAITNEGRA